MKKLKYVGIALAVIILAVGGYIFYEFKLKTYDVADEEVDQLLEEVIEIALPDGTVLTLDKEGNVVTNDAQGNTTGVASAQASGTANNADDATTGASSSTNHDAASAQEQEGEQLGSPTESNNSSTNDENTDNTNGNNTPPAGQATTLSVQDIQAKYAGTFAALQQQAQGRLNALVGRAKSEYVAKVNSGQSIEFGYFYNKYMGAATSMEASIDAAVYAVVAVVENELAANGHDKSHANQFVQQYEATKSSMRSQLMNSVLGK